MDLVPESILGLDWRVMGPPSGTQECEEQQFARLVKHLGLYLWYVPPDTRGRRATRLNFNPRVRGINFFFVFNPCVLVTF